MPKPRARTETQEQPAAKYPKFKIEPNLIEDDNGLTADRAIQLIGFEVEPEEGKWNDDYFGKDALDRKFRVKYNTLNREWTRPWTMRLMQDMLKKNWHGKNGETMSFGTSGRALSCQHRLLALIFAEQERTNPKRAEYWKQFWDGPVTIDAVLVFGVEESSSVVNTLDNVKPRTFADTLFSNPERFKNLKASHRSKAVKIAEFAIRLLWKRTGRTKDAFTPYMTHSEGSRFLDSHPHVVHAVDHIVTEAMAPNSVLSKYCNPGTAAGLLYLMGSSKSDGEKYHIERQQGEVNEKGLNWDLWKKAAAFWGIVSKGQAGAVKDAINAVVDPDTGLGIATQDEKVTILLRAWSVYSAGGTPTMEKIKLTEDDYTTDEKGNTTFKAHPKIGGIDLGNPNVKESGGGEGSGEDGEESSGGEDDTTPTPEETKGETRQQRAQRVEDALAKRFGVGQEKVIKPDAATEGDGGTVHDFEADPEPAAITNKEGLEIEKEGTYRALGAGISRFTVEGFFAHEEDGRTMAKLRKQGAKKDAPTLDVPIDNLMPAETRGRK